MYMHGEGGVFQLYFYVGGRAVHLQKFHPWLSGHK